MKNLTCYTHVSISWSNLKSTSTYNEFLNGEISLIYSYIILENIQIVCVRDNMSNIFIITFPIGKDW